MQELWFSRFACRLILIDIHIKFREDLERFPSYRADTFSCDGQSSEEIIQKV